MSRASPGYLLACLVTRYQQGRVSQAEAAKLLGMRKADFADMVAWQTIERAFWRCYLVRFNYAFPECDRRAVMQAPPASEVWAKSRYRSHTVTEPRTYTEAEMLTPPKRELETGLTA